MKNNDYMQKRALSKEGEIIKSISIYDISKQLTQLKKQKEYEWLNEVPAAALGWSLKHLDTAFKNFYRRLKTGEVAKIIAERAAKGKPFKDGEIPGGPAYKCKFKARKAFSFHQGYTVDFDRSFLTVPKIGKVKVKYHRQFEGKHKTCTIYQDPSGKYYASVVVDDGHPPTQKNEPLNLLGADHGVKKNLTLSNGFVFNINLDFSREEKRLARLQKQSAKMVVGSHNFKKHKIKIAKIYERISFKREHKINNMVHDVALYLLHNHYDGIILRQYDIKGMISKITPQRDGEKFAHNGRKVQKKINKSILKASLGMVFQKLNSKLDECGLNVFAIDAAENKTTQRCNRCGEERDIDINLSRRTIQCKKCDLMEDIDFNAAKNIQWFFENSAKA